MLLFHISIFEKWSGVYGIFVVKLTISSNLLMSIKEYIKWTKFNAWLPKQEFKYSQNIKIAITKIEVVKN